MSQEYEEPDKENDESRGHWPAILAQGPRRLDSLELAPNNRREGTEYVYAVSRDRKHTFLVPVFLRRDATERWAQTHGRPLNGTEEYAAAKMRLFAAFDEIAELEAERLRVEITAENVEELLAALDLE